MKKITNKEINNILSYSYIITMQTKTDKRLYLEISDGGRPNWTFKKLNCCVWDTSQQAISFAKKYFKNFKNYKIREYKEEIEIAE